MAHVPSIFRAELKQDFGNSDPEAERRRTMQCTRSHRSRGLPMESVLRRPGDRGLSRIHIRSSTQKQVRDRGPAQLLDALGKITDVPSLFTSKRERRLWIWALVVVITIYSTLGLTARLVGQVNEGLLGVAFFACLILVGLTILTQGLRVRPGGIARCRSRSVLTRSGGSSADICICLPASDCPPPSVQRSTNCRWVM